MPASQSHLLHPGYRPDIDGLRALAVLSVLIFHAFPHWLQGGFIGVDVFFVISGYLISAIIFKSLESGTFSFSEFYVRRIKRIFPALLLVLVVSYTFGWFALTAYEYKQLGKHIAAGAGFVSNIVLWSESGYFDNSETKPLLHLWSLGIEEQFYIVWPLLTVFFWKRNLNILAITILAAIASFCFNIIWITKDEVATFYFPQTRFWELLCGSLLAWMSLHKSRSFTNAGVQASGWLTSVGGYGKYKFDERMQANVLSFIGLSLLVCGFLWISKDLSFPGMWAIVPVAGAMFIILAGPEAWINRKILSNKIAVWFGLISFPLYLWHWPLLSFARIVGGTTPDYNIRILSLLTSVVLAWLTYRLLERRVRLTEHSKTMTFTLVILITIIGCIGYFTYSNAGFKFRLKTNIVAVEDIVANPLPEVHGIDCARHIAEFKGLEFNGGCWLNKDSLPSIAFVGDSHMLHYKNAIWNNLSKESVLMIVQWACFPFSEAQSSSYFCRKKHEALSHYLENSSSIKTVVLSGNWSYLMSGSFEKTGENWRLAKLFTEEGMQKFKENGATFISKIVKSGKHVIFLKDIPDLDFNVRNCFDIRPLSISLAPTFIPECSMSEARFLQRIGPSDAVIDSLLKPFRTVKIYNPRPLFCSKGKCVAKDNFLPYYRDGDHVNHYGASMVIDDLMNKIDLSGQ
ncbi:acyltransferase family protein [Undibacterium sp. TJN19]|uniref:acyltransferase family protein n=1 Tax=Undibacterium sp. TJN19 TaxID=3413055 RepID=UPI003BF3C66D